MDVPKLLVDYLDQHADVKFEWGKNDCVLFAARWVEKVKGVDPLAKLPKWTNEQQARRVIAKFGSLEAAVTAALGEPVPYGREGDLALLPEGQGGVAVVSGQHLAALSENGLEFAHKSCAVRFWRVTSG